MIRNISIAILALAIPATAFAQGTTVVVPPQPAPQPAPAPSPVVVVPQQQAPAPAPAPTVNVNTTTPAPVENTTVVAGSNDDGNLVYDNWNAPVFTTGAFVFGAAYAASAITAGATDSTSDHRLVVPLLGPWLALSDRPSCDASMPSCDHETTAKVLLVVDGIFQAAGFIGMVDGIVQPSSHRLRHDLAQDKSIHVTPTVVGSDSSPGMAVFGRF